MVIYVIDIRTYVGYVRMSNKLEFIMSKVLRRNNGGEREKTKTTCIDPDYHDLCAGMFPRLCYKKESYSAHTALDKIAGKIAI